MSAKIAIPSAPSGVSTFTFDGHAIRVVEIEGEPWFVAIDVSNALRLERTMFHQRVRALSDDQRRTMTKLVVENTTSSPLLVASLFRGNVGRVTLISESGLYKLILRANASPAATAFQNWVTRDVLPTIRKSDAYVAGQETLAPAQQAEMAAMVADLVARMGVLLDREEIRQKALG